MSSDLFATFGQDDNEFLASEDSGDETRVDNDTSEEQSHVLRSNEESQQPPHQTQPQQQNGRDLFTLFGDANDGVADAHVVEEASNGNRNDSTQPVSSTMMHKLTQVAAAPMHAIQQTVQQALKADHARSQQILERDEPAALHKLDNVQLPEMTSFDDVELDTPDASQSVSAPMSATSLPDRVIKPETEDVLNNVAKYADLSNDIQPRKFASTTRGSRGRGRGRGRSRGRARGRGRALMLARAVSAPDTKSEPVAHNHQDDEDVDVKLDAKPMRPTRRLEKTRTKLSMKTETKTETQPGHEQENETGDDATKMMDKTADVTTASEERHAEATATTALVETAYDDVSNAIKPRKYTTPRGVRGARRGRGRGRGRGSASRGRGTGTQVRGDTKTMPDRTASDVNAKASEAVVSDDVQNSGDMQTETATNTAAPATTQPEPEHANTNDRNGDEVKKQGPKMTTGIMASKERQAEAPSVSAETAYDDVSNDIKPRKYTTPRGVRGGRRSRRARLGGRAIGRGRGRGRGNRDETAMATTTTDTTTSNVDVSNDGGARRARGRGRASHRAKPSSRGRARGRGRGSGGGRGTNTTPQQTNMQQSSASTATNEKRDVHQLPQPQFAAQIPEFDTDDTVVMKESDAVAVCEHAKEDDKPSSQLSKDDDDDGRDATLNDNELELEEIPLTDDAAPQRPEPRADDDTVVTTQQQQQKESDADHDDDDGSDAQKNGDTQSKLHVTLSAPTSKAGESPPTTQSVVDDANTNKRGRGRWRERASGRGRGGTRVQRTRARDSGGQIAAVSVGTPSKPVSKTRKQLPTINKHRSVPSSPRPLPPSQQAGDQEEEDDTSYDQNIAKYKHRASQYMHATGVADVLSAGDASVFSVLSDDRKDYLLQKAKVFNKQFKQTIHDGIKVRYTKIKQSFENREKQLKLELARLQKELESEKETRSKLQETFEEYKQKHVHVSQMTDKEAGAREEEKSVVVATFDDFQLMCNAAYSGDIFSAQLLSNVRDKLQCREPNPIMKQCLYPSIIQQQNLFVSSSSHAQQMDCVALSIVLKLFTLQQQQQQLAQRQRAIDILCICPMSGACSDLLAKINHLLHECAPSSLLRADAIIADAQQSTQQQQSKVRARPHILITTPILMTDVLLAHLNLQDYVTKVRHKETVKLFPCVVFVNIDRCLKSGFGENLRTIYRQCCIDTQNKQQTIWITSNAMSTEIEQFVFDELLKHHATNTFKLLLGNSANAAAAVASRHRDDGEQNNELAHTDLMAHTNDEELNDRVVLNTMEIQTRLQRKQTLLSELSKLLHDLQYVQSQKTLQTLKEGTYHGQFNRSESNLSAKLDRMESKSHFMGTFAQQLSSNMDHKYMQTELQRLNEHLVQSQAMMESLENDKFHLSQIINAKNAKMQQIEEERGIVIGELRISLDEMSNAQNKLKQQASEEKTMLTSGLKKIIEQITQENEALKKQIQTLNQPTQTNDD